MFTLQNWKVKLAYAAFGCLFGSICTIMGLLASPVTAQRDKFGDIECSSLRVVDATGVARVRIRLGAYGGYVGVYGKDSNSRASLGVTGYGGDVEVYDRDGQVKAVLGVHEHGGVVSVGGKATGMGAQLGVNERGGIVQVEGKGESAAVMSISEYGNGVVATWDKNGYQQ